MSGRARWLLLCCCLVAALDFRAANAAELKDTLKRIKPGVVAVGTFMPLRQPRGVFKGTGFVVADGQHLITNHHVVAQTLDRERNEILAIFVPQGREEGRALEARILHCDPPHDLCLLRFQGASLPALKLGRAADVQEGQAYALTGFPLGMVLGLYPATHQGIVAAITPIVIPATSTKDFSPRMIRALRAPFDVFQLDAIAYPGNSGSPLYEIATGRVVGVVNSVFVKGTKEAALENPSGISYAIPVTYVYELLRKAGLQP